jgi:DNA mismatch repair protein MutS
LDQKPCEQPEFTPLIKQYYDVKSQYPELLLFFRVGDFYELFDDDARLAAKELDITLTGRPESSYPGGRIPMAGVPVRSVEMYLSRLLTKGYSIALCEQVGVVGAEKGPVERRVTRILTPGTVLESHLLPARESNYLAAILRGTSKEFKSGANANSGDTWGLAYVDASCGEFFVTQLSEDELLLELGRISPSEILVAKRVVKPGLNEVVAREVLDIPDGLKDQYHFVGRGEIFFEHESSKRRIQNVFGVTTLEGFGCHAMPLAVRTAGAILEYLERTQGREMPKFDGISTYFVESQLVIDANTRRNLELVETLRDRSFQGSLLWVLDQTQTPMGSRNLRKWLLQPLYSVPHILARQEAIAEIIGNAEKRSQITECLGRLSDLERLSVKLSSGTINPRELLAVSQSVNLLPEMTQILAGAQSAILRNLSSIPSDIVSLCQKIEKAICPEPPREITEGGIFQNGYSKELDEIRQLLGGGKTWIDEYQKEEQIRSGIKTLKVNFNRTFGYYIEITNSYKDSAPKDYIRKQTLTNAERYITPALKEYEAKILNAEKHQSELEYKLYVELRASLILFGPPLLTVARQLADLDALVSLANVAIARQFIRPTVDDGLVLDIKNGRHPVLEKILPAGRYVANDTRLEGDSPEHQFVVLTGPNMSGKSSFLRQIAHISILAQIGSYVPADAARIGLVDRIFTRIGAVDDLTQGQSTFLVEMSEVTQCCLSATKNSLILLDEVGRGTSTYDGVAIAWSVAEFLAREIRARTVFATHYHELNGLANFIPQIVNYQMLVKEQDGQVQFIRSVVTGGASRSFGVQVARMSGLPLKIIERAEQLMNQMERKSAARSIVDGPKFREVSMEEALQLSIFEGLPVLPKTQKAVERGQKKS